ncbi:MAG: D-amino-acid transaminase [Hyphomicrobiales bacterium]
MSRTVYLNGEFMAEEDAKVSIFDRGYLFGDGIYEVVPVIGGLVLDRKPFVERFDRSLRELEIAWPCSEDELHAMIDGIIERNELDEGIVYMQVTRGVADRDFHYPADTPTTLMAFHQVKSLLNNPKAESGVKVVTVDDIRWKRRDVKSIALLAQCVAKEQAVKQGAQEGWMVEDGLVTEGTSSTSYIVKDGVIITRPLSVEVLPGIRRKVLLRLAEEHQIKVELRAFTPEEAKSADEAFLSSASTFVLPIVEIDGVTIGGGVPGPLAKRMREVYIDTALKIATEEAAA